MVDVYRGGWEDARNLNPSPGDIIDFNRTTYTHHGVYVGNGYVVHKLGKNEGPMTSTIMKQKLIGRCTMVNIMAWNRFCITAHLWGNPMTVRTPTFPVLLV